MLLMLKNGTSANAPNATCKMLNALRSKVFSVLRYGPGVGSLI